MIPEIFLILCFIAALWLAHWVGRKQGNAEATIEEDLIAQFFETGHSIKLNLEDRYEVTDSGNTFVLSAPTFEKAVMFTLIGLRGSQE